MLIIGLCAEDINYLIGYLSEVPLCFYQLCTFVLYMESLVNPLILEFKIPAEPINAGDKMAAPRREPISVRIMLYSPFITVEMATVRIFS